MSLLTSSPFSPPERRYSPSVSSPLNPQSCYEPASSTQQQFSPRKPKRSMSAVSPTQYLLRQKAIAAWHAEMLRKDLCNLVHGTAAGAFAGPERPNTIREALLSSSSTAVAAASPKATEANARIGWTDTRHAKAKTHHPRPSAGDVYLSFGLTFPSPFAPESAFPISWPCITLRRIFFLVGLMLGVLVIRTMLGVVDSAPMSLILSTTTQEHQQQYIKASMLTLRNGSSYSVGQIRAAAAMPTRT
ncbi:hypothetical protein B0T19DRAFT_444124 [Cercophora scortea]|uniref:Uncharacterized protein n=1 Tax=Cercophora scortea TaxID=314031 RepID=A0AAE0IGI4_9PEZI|nr:hypothetical protein B0T19DRAFT_444124 [Cercophora scortea]